MPLIPPDLKQCQAEKPNGTNFMTLGGNIGGMVRCTNKPTVIAHENYPSDDGQCGSMSLCDDCSEVMKKQLGPGFAVFEKIIARLTEAEMVNRVVGWFNNAPEKNRKEFINCTKDGLVMYHHTLGHTIRNEFGLWQVPWVPELRDGTDYSPNHPDEISMRVIIAVHDHLTKSSSIGQNIIKPPY